MSMQDSFFFFYLYKKAGSVPLLFCLKSTNVFIFVMPASISSWKLPGHTPCLDQSIQIPLLSKQILKKTSCYFLCFFYFSFILKNKRTNAVPTFFLFGAAEAAAGLLELIAVNFDHPKRAKDFGQVRGLVTGGQRSHLDKLWISARLDGMIDFFSFWTRLTRQRGRSSTWWRLRWWPRRCLRSGCRPGPRWGNRRSCWCPDIPLKHSRDSQNHNPSQ